MLNLTNFNWLIKIKAIEELNGLLHVKRVQNLIKKFFSGKATYGA